MKREAWILFLVLYLLLDFCTPLIDGAVGFDLDDCVDCTQVERLRSECPACILQPQPGLVAMPPSERALLPVSSPAPAGAATRMPFVVRTAFASAAGPPDSAEDH